jgi:phospholipid/cholesterol/gamma-HCH transport system ATP-binding protein
MKEVILKIENLKTVLGKQVVHNGISLEACRGEILGVIGASGSGKTVLMKVILGLIKPRAGKISLFGVNTTKDGKDLLRMRCGVLFQSGALFSSLTIKENIEIPMIELTKMPASLREELAFLKLSMVGLPPETASKLPSELSGGMIKRAALARALAIDAELLFLDEPTSGLDPISAGDFDVLLKTLQKNLNLTVIMVTHDLECLYDLCDKVAVLVDGKVIVGSLREIEKHNHPWIKSYFQGRKGRRQKGA